MSQDPRTPEEWQIAVDAAEMFTMLESAKAFGLIAGGPVVDMSRCEQILERGAALGFRPDVTEEKLRDFVLACGSGEQSE